MDLKTPSSGRVMESFNTDIELKTPVNTINKENIVPVVSIITDENHGQDRAASSLWNARKLLFSKTLNKVSIICIQKHSCGN